jgi:predicted RNase H-like nuclease (RuvC/YqgF family)
MVYAKHRTCDSCDESKPDTEFYKTIKDVCKICRDERMQEERQRSKEDSDNGIDKHTRDFKNLKRTVGEQTETIGDMKSQIKSMRKNMANMREELDELSDLKARMKGMTLGRLKAKSG